jgi:hypothetical protein
MILSASGREYIHLTQKLTIFGSGVGKLFAKQFSSGLRGRRRTFHKMLENWQTIDHGNDLEPNIGLKFGTPIWDPDLGPRFGTPIWDPDLGPPIWDPDLGPRYGSPIWDPDLRPRFGTPILDPNLGPRFGTPIFMLYWDALGLPWNTI